MSERRIDGYGGRTMTPKQEVRYLGWIARRVLKLTPAGRRWLRSWLNDRTVFPNG